MNAMRSLTRIRRHKEELNRADENKIEVKKNTLGRINIS